MASTITLSATQARDHYAVGIPGHIIRYASHNTLPLPVSSSSSDSRSRRATPVSAIRRLDLQQCFKILIASAIGMMGVVATWWALDLAMWTAVKDYRDDCRNSASAGYEISHTCKEILQQSLGAPPTWKKWRTFTLSSPSTEDGPGHKEAFRTLAAAATRDVQKRWTDWLQPMNKYNAFGPQYAKLRDSSIVEGSSLPPWIDPVVTDLGGWHRQKQTPYLKVQKTTKVSPSPSSSPISDSHAEYGPHRRPLAYYRRRAWAADSEIAKEGIQRQGDASIMYGATETNWTHLCGAWSIFSDDELRLAREDRKMQGNSTMVDIAMSFDAQYSPSLNGRGSDSTAIHLGELQPSALATQPDLIQTVVFFGMLLWVSYIYLKGGPLAYGDEGRKMSRPEKEAQNRVRLQSGQKDMRR